MVIILANWQVWNKNYNPSFYKLVAEFNTRREAERFVQQHDADFWDEENGFLRFGGRKGEKNPI